MASRITPKNRKVPKNVSMDLAMIEAVEHQAIREGHGNFSALVVKALEQYLDVELAAEDAETEKVPA